MDADYLEDMLKAYSRLWEGDRLPQVFDSIAGAALAAFAPRPELDPGVTLWLWDGDRLELFLGAAVNEGIAEEPWDVTMACERGSCDLPLCFPAIQDPHQLWVQDVFSESSSARGRTLCREGYVRGEGFRSLLATPVREPHASRVVGVINVFFRGEATYEMVKPQARLIELLAQQAALSIDKRAADERRGAVLRAREAGTKAATAEQFLNDAALAVAESLAADDCTIYLPHASLTGLLLRVSGTRAGPWPDEIRHREGIVGMCGYLGGRILRVLSACDPAELEHVQRTMGLPSWDVSDPAATFVHLPPDGPCMAAPLPIYGWDQAVGVIVVTRGRERSASWNRFTPRDADLLTHLCGTVTGVLSHFIALGALTRDLSHRHGHDLRMLQAVRLGETHLSDVTDFAAFEKGELVGALRSLQVMLDGAHEVNKALQPPLPVWRDTLNLAPGRKHDLAVWFRAVARQRFRVKVTEDSYEPSYQIEENVMLDERRVMHACVILNELITNIQKHAVPDADGTVRPVVRLSRRDRQMVDMTTINHAREAPPRTGTGASCGTSIVESIAETLLGGEVRTSYDDDTSLFKRSVSFPVDAPRRKNNG